MPPPAVSVLVVDDHPALRAGLEQLLDQEPGYRLLGSVSSEAELAIALQRHRPDVVVMDYALTRGDGLSACFRLERRPHPPYVVFYSAYVDDIFAVPATLAQADAIVSKSDPVEVLLTAIHAVAAGETQVPASDPEVIEAASSRLRRRGSPDRRHVVREASGRRHRDDPRRRAAGVRSRALRIIGEMQAHERRHGHAAV